VAGSLRLGYQPAEPIFWNVIVPPSDATSEAASRFAPVTEGIFAAESMALGACIVPGFVCEPILSPGLKQESKRHAIGKTSRRPFTTDDFFMTVLFFTRGMLCERRHKRLRRQGSKVRDMHIYNCMNDNVHFQEVFIHGSAKTRADAGVAA
jgi:hypothetical protein